MELSFDKLKVYVPVAVTILSSLTSGFIVAKNYIKDNFVETHEFDQMKINVTIGVLENKKAMLENRLYFLDICKTSRTCSYRTSVATDIEKTVRELEDVRSHLETAKNKRLD